MAQQTAVKKAVKVPETSPVKPPRASGKQARVFDYTKFRQSFRSDKDFQLYLAGYPNRTGILGYVYRLKPAIDMSLIGVSENSILKTSNVLEMTQEFVASRFGRGKYLLKLSDANRPRGETEACRTWFEVDDPDLTPIYDPRTLKLGDPENQDEIARLMQAGILIRDTGGAPRFRTQADGEQAAPAAAAGNGHNNGSGDIFSKDILGQVIMKLVSNGSASPADSVKQAVEVARMLQPASPQLSPEQLAELVVAKLERTSTRTNSEGDMFQTYERMEAFIQKVKGPAPVLVPEGGSPGLALTSQILGYIDAIVPKVFIGLQQLQSLRNSQPRPGKRVAVANGQQQQNGGQQEITIADRILEIARIGFEKMQQGVNGHDYAAYVCNFMPGGLEVFRLLESQGPGAPAAVMGLASMNPQLAPFLNGTERRAQVETFLGDFISFDSDPLGAEELPTPASSGAAAAASA